MKYKINTYVDYLIESNDGDYRGVISKLLRKLDTMEKNLFKSYRDIGYNGVMQTFIGLLTDYIDVSREVKNKEDEKK